MEHLLNITVEKMNTLVISKYGNKFQETPSISGNVHIWKNTVILSLFNIKFVFLKVKNDMPIFIEAYSREY